MPIDNVFIWTNTKPLASLLILHNALFLNMKKIVIISKILRLHIV